jgi:hypothetical protein
MHRDRGLRAYFSDAEIAYVQPFAPIAMRRVAEELSGDNDRRFSMVVQRNNINYPLV